MQSWVWCVLSGRKELDGTQLRSWGWKHFMQLDSGSVARVRWCTKADLPGARCTNTTTGDWSSPCLTTVNNFFFFVYFTTKPINDLDVQQWYLVDCVVAVVVVVVEIVQVDSILNSGRLHLPTSSNCISSYIYSIFIFGLKSNFEQKSVDEGVSAKGVWLISNFFHASIMPTANQMTPLSKNVLSALWLD